MLRVLAPHAFGQDQMIAPLQSYLQRYPKMTVDWMLSDRRPDFIAEGIDCAVHVGPVTDPSVVALLVAEVPRIVIGTPALLAQRPLPRHPQQLQDLPWLSLSIFYRHSVTLSHEQSGETQRFDIQPRLMTDSLYALRNAALAGMGVGIASSWVVAEDIARGELLHLAPEWQASALPVYLVYPHARYYPARLRMFLALMKEVMPALSGTQHPGR